jgi:predicted nucleic acid-binding Zn finger protein
MICMQVAKSNDKIAAIEGYPDRVPDCLLLMTVVGSSTTRYLPAAFAR